MKIPLGIILLFTSFFFSSCNSQDEKKEDNSKSKFAIITLNLNYSSQTIVETKAVMDCNIYYYCDQLRFSHHTYGTYGSAVVESLPQGTYDIYTIVGYGSDLGPKTKAELESILIYSTDRGSVESNNVYSNKSKHTITSDATINIAVTRLLAKVDFNITVDAAFAPNFTLESVELLNINNQASLYADSKLTSGAINYPKEAVTGTTVSKSYLITENLQGINGSITDQRHKTSGNAPSDKCSHLHIRGYSNGAKVDYYIYLGANNTNDFNIKRNNHYIINTTIFGINDIDNRVSVVDASITEFEKTIYELPEPAKSTLKLMSIRQGSPIYLSYQILEGNGLLSVDGTQVQPNTQHLLSNGGDINATIPLLFGQLQDGNVRLYITVTDNNGFSYSKEIATKYESIKELIVTDTGGISEKIGDKSTITLDISEENYTDDFTIKYEIISGTLEVSHNYTILSSGATVSGKAGKFDFSCLSVALGDIKIKFTVTDSKGQSKEIIKLQTVKSVINVTYKITGENIITQSMEYALNNYHNSMQSRFIFYFDFSESLPCDITVNNIFVEFKIKDIGNPNAYNSNVFKLSPLTIAKGRKSYRIDQTVDYTDPYCQLKKGIMTNCSTPYSFDGIALQGDLKLISHVNGNLDGELELIKILIESNATESTDERYYFEFREN